MEKYYAVCTSCYDNGRITSNLVDAIEAEERPENTWKSTRRCDIYVNWFDSYDEAMEFIKEHKKA